MPEPTFELLERIAQELRDEIAEQRARLRRLEDVQDHLARVLGDDGPLTEGLTEVCAPRVEPAPRRKVTEEFARDTLVRLKEVTVGQYADALGLSQTRARAYLKRFERRKMLEVVVRDDARAHLYRYIDPRTAPPGPKVNGSHARTRARAKGSPVPGTGRQRRFRKEVQQVLDEATMLGGVLDTKGDHPRVRMPGGRVVTFPGTPSDHHSLANSRAEIKKISEAREAIERVNGA